MFKDIFTKKEKYFSIPVTRGEAADPNKPSSPRRCPSCTALIRDNELAENLKVCPRCGYHHPLTAPERIAQIFDDGSFFEADSGIRSFDVLQFPGYEEKLYQARERSGLAEAVVTGQASIEGQPAVIGVMDSNFMMGSMGSAVGEKVTRAIERAAELKLPLIIFTASGGARMQEGMLSLMQMAKTSAALGKLNALGLLYISVLTHPTTGGVTASFASLADVIVAEPGALIGFTGPRVVRQTVGQKIPVGFQQAEFMLEHGLIDLVENRHQLRTLLARLLRFHQGGCNG